jgi:hypothetical protein
MQNLSNGLNVLHIVKVCIGECEFSRVGELVFIKLYSAVIFKGDKFVLFLAFLHSLSSCSSSYPLTERPGRDVPCLNHLLLLLLYLL